LRCSTRSPARRALAGRAAARVRALRRWAVRAPSAHGPPRTARRAAVNSFIDILRAMVERVPGALGASFVDWEGEAVETFSTNVPRLDIQIIGAQWGVVWTQLQKSFQRAHLGTP